jgi:hypothetical protein
MDTKDLNVGSSPDSPDNLHPKKSLPGPDGKAELKKRAFDKELRALFAQSEETIIARYGEMKTGDIRDELLCLRRYLEIYEKTDPQNHYGYFETLYNRKRQYILNCLRDDRWIRTGNVTIQFGAGIKVSKEMEERRQFIKIMLSDIFLIACDVQERTQRSFDGVDEKFIQEAGGKDLIRPNIILLHLMRIFYHLNDGDDKTQLGVIVTQLETDLGVKNKTVQQAQAPVADIASQVGASPAAAGGLSGLFTMATNMMQKMGYEPPPGMKPPSENEISSVISTVFNNETTQNAIQGMFSSLQGCQDFGSAVQTVVKNVTDPETMKAIQGSVRETAEMAALNPQEAQNQTLQQISSINHQNKLI